MITAPPSSRASNPVSLPAITIIAIGAGNQVALLTEDGEIKLMPADQAAALIHKKPVLCCHAPYTRQRLGGAEFYAFDILELFAFTHPAIFAVPTPHGICDILNLDKPQNLEDIPFALMDAARILLSHLQYDQLEAKAPPLEIAGIMGLQGKSWPWTPYIFAALGHTYDPAIPVNGKTALNIWKHLPEWQETAPRPPPHHHPVEADETLRRLGDLLQTGDHKVEPRPQQKEYAAHIASAFATPQSDVQPHIILAEAGTGTGKTLGYLAPASLWAEKNQGAVWVSTYTKNLQRQIARELDRLYPTEVEKEKHVAIRKGRENYLCLLNLEDAAAAATTTYTPQHAIAAGIMTRWTAATKDGDLTGADFPGWLTGILGYAGTLGLADQRGECIYSACDHYKKCFSENSIRNAKNASIVVANHALVMIQSAMAGPMETLPSRYIFDEGHHLFDAADSAFAAHLTAQETRDMRRWILGNEGGGRGRARGLKRRAEDLCNGDSEAAKLLQNILDAAGQLTADSWTRRLKNAAPQGPCEEFLYAVMQQINARTQNDNTPYSLETPVHPVDTDIQVKSIKLRKILEDLTKPMRKMATIFMNRLRVDNDTKDMMDSDTRKRIESVAKSLEYRAMIIQAWVGILDSLKIHPSSSLQNQTSNLQFVDWMEITRESGQAIDIGIFRHYIDPMKPFADAIAPHLHGMAVTSATLRDEDGEQAWHNAQTLTGAKNLSKNPQHFSAASPFDYAQQTQIYIIDDVNKNDSLQVAHAFQALFEASGGGGLGLFTAINRLRTTHENIHANLESKGIQLYAQHVDDIDIGTLIDMFRFDKNACMLGTDAARDGIDIPGDSLRLLAFDRVPWPRPTMLHKARRDHFGGRTYDEMITRLKLKQAFGRLIRKADDKGVFVMLDSALPSRLQTAFPSHVTINKCGLAEACKSIHSFLNQ
jgi:ATP-dependent DNA helicase DinG